MAQRITEKERSKISDFRPAHELSMGDIGAGRLSSATRNAPPVDEASAEQILASFTGAPTRAHRARNKYTTPSAHEIFQMQQAFQSKQKQAQQEMRSQ